MWNWKFVQKKMDKQKHQWQLFANVTISNMSSTGIKQIVNRDRSWKNVRVKNVIESDLERNNDASSRICTKIFETWVSEVVAFKKLLCLHDVKIFLVLAVHYGIFMIKFFNYFRVCNIWCFFFLNLCHMQLVNS